MDFFKSTLFWIFLFGVLAALGAVFALVYTTSRKWGDYSPPDAKAGKDESVRR